jgi:hypothetical protein
MRVRSLWPCAALLVAAQAGAQTARCPAYTDAPTKVGAVADAKDVASQDAIIAALYDVISGPACQKRDWDRFKSLFVPGARLIPTVRGPDGKFVTRVQSPDDYAAGATQTLQENGFFENEISRTVENFGSISHRFSTYESRRKAADEKPFARGINSIQMLYDGTRWWIVTVYWQGERQDNPIPEQFLRKP